jgi:hypothetical protein
MGKPSAMTSIPASPETRRQVGRAAHDLGLAGLLGGTLFGRMALHPAVASISDPRERGEVVNAAWRRYGFVNALALAAVTGGWAGARPASDARPTPAELRLVRAKDGLVGALVLCGVASAVEGMRFARSAPGGAVPLADGAHPSAETPEAAARLKRRLNALGAATLTAEVGLVAVNAVMAQSAASSGRRRRRPRVPAR